MGNGTLPENSVRIRVFTITITAPQQEHRIGARSFTQAINRPGSNFMSRRDGIPMDSTKGSKAIRRLQLGCRKPKLRARRKALGSTCCRTSQRKCVGNVPSGHA